MAELAPTVTPSKLSRLRKPATVTASMMTGGRPEEAELILAAMRGDSKEIERLLSTDRPLRRRSTLLSISNKSVSIDIHVQDTMGRTALHWIAGQGHEDCVDIIMKHPGAESLIASKDGRTPLHEAAMKGHAKTMENLFKYDIFLDHKNIDKEDNCNRTALHWAALGGHKAIVDLLIEKGANTGAITTDGKSALHLAAIAGSEAIMATLFCRASPEQRGDEGLIRVYLDHDNVQVDTEDEEKRTLLSYASESGHHDIVKLLVEKGADIETTNNWAESWRTKTQDGRIVESRELREKIETNGEESGLTPLSWAARGGHEGIVELLVEKGAYIETKNYHRQTSLSWAARGGHEGVVKLLVEKGANIEAGDRWNQTPLFWAAREGHVGVVELLANKGADIETKNGHSETPLSYAAREGRKGVVELLANKGVDFETKDFYPGHTALSWAAREGHQRVVELLTEKGADINTRDDYGQTALSWATVGGYEGVVKLLVEKGADDQMQDDHIQLTFS